MKVQLGNTAPVEVLDRDDVKARGLNLRDHDVHAAAVEQDGEVVQQARYRVAAPHAIPDGEDHTVTTVVFPDGIDLLEAFVNVTAPQGVWAHHSDEPPAWVASDDETLASMLARQYGCEVVEYDESRDALPQPPEVTA